MCSGINCTQQDGPFWKRCNILRSFQFFEITADLGQDTVNKSTAKRSYLQRTSLRETVQNNFIQSQFHQFVIFCNKKKEKSSIANSITKFVEKKKKKKGAAKSSKFGRNNNKKIFLKTRQNPVRTDEMMILFIYLFVPLSILNPL